MLSGTRAAGGAPSSRRLWISAAAIAAAAALSIAGPPGAGVGPAQAQACAGAGADPGEAKATRAQRAVVCLLNKRRANRDRPALRLRAPLRRAAKRYSTRMRNRGCFSHTCGSTLLRRVERTPYLPCNCRFGLGETLAWGPEARGRPRAIVKAWMDSPGHRRVLMDAGFRHIGVGTVWGSPYAKRDSSHATYTAVVGYKR